MTTLSLATDDRLSQASQLQLTWWRFRRHRLAVVSLIVVALFYLGAVFADFLAVVDPHATDARRSFIPPQAIALFDNGAFRPHVSGLKGVRDPKSFKLVYTPDPARKLPVALFVHGYPYNLFGLISTDRHLLGIEGGQGVDGIFLLGTDQLGRDLRHHPGPVGHGGGHRVHRPAGQLGLEQAPAVLGRRPVPVGDPARVRRGKRVADPLQPAHRLVDALDEGIAVTATGHSHPKVVEAIQRQAEKYLHISSDYYHEPMVALGERINELAPMKENVGVFFANSGTEAVEAAIKLARYATRRTRFIGFLGAFHGRSMGSLSFTASKFVQQERFFPTMPGVMHVPFPDAYRPVIQAQRGGDYGDTIVDYIEEVLFANVLPPDEVAAVVVEPIQGEGGDNHFRPEFFRAVRQLCDENDMLLIFDEVQSGVGITGKMWAFQHYGVEPDLFCFGKKTQVCGFASNDRIFDIEENVFTVPSRINSTWGGNLTDMVRSQRYFEVIDEERLVDNAARVGAFFIGELERFATKFPRLVSNVRGRGLMAAFVLSLIVI